MNAKERSTYWLKVERLRKGIERKYEKEIANSITKQFKRFASDVKRFGVDVARSRLGLEMWESEMIKIFERMYKETVITFGNATYRVLKIQANQKAENFGFNAEWTREVMQFLTQQGFVMVSDITKTTKDKLLSIVAKGIEDGLDIDNIVKLITSDENIGYSLFRARRIARTEVMRASNIGAMKGAQAHNFQVDKVWISARDLRTRRIPRDEFDHLRLDGTTVDLDETFNTTGKNGQQVEAMQPGDITQPAAFTINCRCTVGFVPKRDARGRLIFKPRTNSVSIDIIDQPIKITQQQTISQANNKNQAKSNIKTIFENRTNLKINKISISDDLDINQLNKRIEALDNLTNEYNISPIIKNEPPTNVIFKSTKNSYGYVTYLGSGDKLKNMNFGDKTDSYNTRKFNEYDRFIRSKSRVDEKNIDIATTVHEFGHLIGIDVQKNNLKAPEWFKKWFSEIREIEINYYKEIRGYNMDKDFYNMNQISLGKYASTNTNEFIAEAFTEYKLSSNPSKYAILVGKSIDKYFKK